jgi:hypothetical protein
MKSGSLVKNTVAACAVIAVAAAIAGSVTGHVVLGFGLAAGLMLGSLNGYLIQGLIARGAPFAAASLLRILFFSSLALIAALTLRGSAWSFALGIGVAQLVMVAVGIRQGLRA